MRPIPFPNELAGAVADDDPAKVRDLLARGASLRWRSDRKLYGMKPYRADLLDVAYDSQALAAAEALLDAGMRLHPSSTRPNAFHMACKDGNLDFIRLLMRARRCSALTPRPYPKAPEETPLSWVVNACATHRPQAMDAVVAALLEKPATFTADAAAELVGAVMGAGLGPEWLEQKAPSTLTLDWPSLAAAAQVSPLPGLWARVQDWPHCRDRMCHWLQYLSEHGVQADAALPMQPPTVAASMQAVIADLQARRLAGGQSRPGTRRLA